MKWMLVIFSVMLLASPIFADSLNYTFTADDMSLYANFTNAQVPIFELLLEDQLNLTEFRSNLTSKDGVLINFTQYGYTTIFLMLGMQLPSYIDSANVTNLTISAAACDDAVNPWVRMVHVWSDGFSGFSEKEPVFNCDAVQTTVYGADSAVATADIFSNNSMGWTGIAVEETTSEASIDQISVTVFYEGTTTTTSTTTTSTSTTTTSTTSTTLAPTTSTTSSTTTSTTLPPTTTLGVAGSVLTDIGQGTNALLQGIVPALVLIIIAFGGVSVALYLLLKGAFSQG